jgi:hypothetical protein
VGIAIERCRQERRDLSGGADGGVLGGEKEMMGRVESELFSEISSESEESLSEQESLQAKQQRICRPRMR